MIVHQMRLDVLCILMVVFDLSERQRYPQIFSILGSFETSSESIDGLVSSAAASACLCSMSETVIYQIIRKFTILYSMDIYIYIHIIYMYIFSIKTPYVKHIWVTSSTQFEKKHHLPRVHSWVPNVNFPLG